MTKFVNEAAMKAGIDAVEKGYDQAAQMTKEQLGKVFPAAAENFDEVIAFNKQNLTAAVDAGKATAKVWEAFGKEVAAVNQKAVETGIANMKALFACKTVQEAFELQAEQARAGFDTALATGTKLGELAAKATNDAVQPITARATKAAEKFTKDAAA